MYLVCYEPCFIPTVRYGLHRERMAFSYKLNTYVNKTNYVNTWWRHRPNSLASPSLLGALSAWSNTLTMPAVHTNWELNLAGTREKEWVGDGTMLHSWVGSPPHEANTRCGSFRLIDDLLCVMHEVAVFALPGFFVLLSQGMDRSWLPSFAYSLLNNG